MAPRSSRWDGNAVYWRREPSYQLPSDLFRYQEIVVSYAPDWIIETGGGGGTSWFLADICNLEEHGRVYPVRENSLQNVPKGLEGSVMCILDSDVYSEQHMRDELQAYAPLVTQGQHLVVCHTDRADWGSAPALGKYLRAHRGEFEKMAAPEPTLCTYLLRK